MHGRRFVVLGVVVLVAMGSLAPVAALEDVPTQDPHHSNAQATGVECSFPLTVTDDTGTEITLEDEPDSVVTLAPSAAQTMWEIGAAEKVTGVTQHAANLEGAEDRTNISTAAQTVEPELVVAEEPDLVLAPSSEYVSEETVNALRESGLTVHHFESAESIDDVRERTHRIGSLVGECEGTAETVAWMDEELELVESTIEGEDRPDVLYTFFGFTAGEGTFIDTIIETAGGTNVAAEAGIEEYAELNEETVIEMDPDWIVLNTNSPTVPDSPAYDSTTAVENDQAVIIDVNHLNRPGPRTVHAVSELAEALHPDAYAEATEEPDASGDEPDASGSDRTDERPADGTDAVPGFGPIATALAVALLLGAIGAIRQDNTRS
ncbi:ABC transporter substrate-binding protein [Salinadaptatus halalkaliphilus]|uniref:ABC transporter substrate-binding protein n=1 Tax=Salinadaptatus halalkaliphilus TaxID=2419781 RepID=A0A4S3TND8_9EURY|nr:PGF-CTERM-anchored ABC transporter substrate-binding protein [Salinadaptatus halalkaliphilus]THE65771.1 ABC transporter substrate-binding protein [Salinadaptatus halalkaliphilus]